MIYLSLNIVEFKNIIKKTQMSTFIHIKLKKNANIIYG